MHDINFCVTCLRDQFWAQTLDGLTLGAVYALIALGYTLVYGVLQLINFAHSEIFMIGVFAVLSMLSQRNSRAAQRLDRFSRPASL